MLHSNKRRRFWDDIFQKYSIETNDDESFAFNEIPISYEISPKKSKKEKVTEVDSEYTTSEKKLIEKIEVKLQSNLYRLVLLREKTKLLLDRKGYNSINPQFKDEVERLQEYLTVYKIKNYIKLCFQEDTNIKELKRDKSISELASLLYQQKQVMGDKKLRQCINRRVREEWTALTKVIPEDDLIIYAVNLVKNFDN